ncbi:MAG TPA: hypothetical protein VF623_04080 [Segetibacter sp.]|jgi:hypothetical protein
MKKLLFVFVLGAFAACGGGSSETTTDSTSVSTTDSTTMGTGSGTMMTDSTSM